MKAIYRTVWLLALGWLLWPYPAAAQTLEQDRDGYRTTITKTFDVRSDGVLLMDDITGAVEVQAWSDSRVQIIEELRMDVDRNEAEEIVEQALQMYSQEGDEVRVRGDKDRRWNRRDRYVSRRYHIRVPQRFNLDVSTSGGAIAVTDVTGRVDVATSGGAIDMVGVKGTVDATTSGGSLDFRAIDGRVYAATSGGRIRLDGITGEIDVSTSGGGITINDAAKDVSAATSGGSLAIENVAGNLNASTSGGNIEVEKVAGEVRIATSGGWIRMRDLQSRVRATTSGGDISGSGFGGDLDLTTSAGDIDVRDVRGAVEAYTSVGDIEVQVTLTDFSKRHYMDLSTNHGDIRISLPANLPATISAEIDRVGRYDRHDIYSDFALSRSSDSRRSDTVRSTGDINGGGDRITLRTSGGSIYINKDR